MQLLWLTHICGQFGRDVLAFEVSNLLWFTSRTPCEKPLTIGFARVSLDLARFHASIGSPKLDAREIRMELVHV